MKPFFLLLLSSFIAAGLDAQSDDGLYFKELGLNATPFINQYLDLGSGNGEFSSPYMLTYEQRFNRIGARFGIGLVSSDDTQEPDDDFTQPEFRQYTTTLDCRLGAVFYKDISKRWDIKYGLDLMFRYNSFGNVTTNTDAFGDQIEATQSTISSEVGLSPFFFVQFHINEHFSLATEILGKASTVNSVVKEQNSEFPEFDDIQRSSGMRFNISPPTALFFIYRF